MTITNLITGGAGFVAQTLVARLLDRGEAVLAVDNLSRGREAFLARFRDCPRFSFAAADCSDARTLIDTAARIAPGGVTQIWHLAANSDIPAGIADPAIDLKDTFLTTFASLEAARVLGVEHYHFASSSAVYGDFGDVIVHEDIGPLLPISNYGAMKLASEAQIRAAVEAFLPRANIFRFPNVIGVPATHGVILDFVAKLRATPDRLEVLGDGTQRKPYLHVRDLVDAMLFIAGTATGRHNVFNIGPRDTGVTVKFIAETVRDRVSPAAEIAYGSGPRGWVGDVPRFNYSTERLRELGWQPQMGSREAIEFAVKEIAEQEQVS